MSLVKNNKGLLIRTHGIVQWFSNLSGLQNILWTATHEMQIAGPPPQSLWFTKSRVRPTNLNFQQVPRRCTLGWSGENGGWKMRGEGPRQRSMLWNPRAQWEEHGLQHQTVRPWFKAQISYMLSWIFPPISCTMRVNLTARGCCK